MNGSSLPQTLPCTTRFALAPIALLMLLAYGGAHALPVGGQVVAGQASVVQTNAQNLIIQQGSPRAVLDWLEDRVAALEEEGTTGMYEADLDIEQ